MSLNNLQKTILVTGGAGFIGSNFIPYFLEANKHLSVLNLDKLTYAGNLDNLCVVANKKRYSFIKGDITNRQIVEKVFKENQIDGVIHFAAESHVDNSIHNPGSFIKTNIDGTFVLLEAAKDSWGEHNIDKRFHHISTDEVYGSLGQFGFFTEETPYAPNSPYSASKAASDFLVRSYGKTYGLNVVTTNCSNNFGPKQHDEKLIPTVIRKAIELEKIPIYGNGKNIRDWLYVIDHCEGINEVFHNGKSGETYLFGGNNEYNNLQIANKICSILDIIKPRPFGSYMEQITFVTDRKGHDYRYAINAHKCKEELGWEPSGNFDSVLKKTVQWYIEKYNKLKK
ncbi:dTDP-glucose 4,6-dehydratase [Maribacter antarcticus]|uniref:dTDP-glucose 4,6-dehydratase n=1 Tax=Maribacter antarcticus TaxID=505250 RepID=UPI0012EB2D57|nr:dTDP-glucose 4,6-dehydratase [Maribacter antarcticus]